MGEGGPTGLGVIYPCVDNDGEADDAHNETRDHQKYSPDGVKGSEGSWVDLEVDNAGVNKQQAGGSCRSHYAKHISDVRHKEGQQQPHTQDGESCNDVDQPGEGPTSKQHQHHSLAGRKVNQGYSQQHREQDGQANHHHHDVPRHKRVVTEQQLRVHMSVEAEVSKERRNEVNGKAEANTDIGNVLHPGLTRSVQFAVDWKHSGVAQEGKGHGGDGEAALTGDDKEFGCTI